MLGELREFGVRGYDGISEMMRMQFFWHPDQSRNMESALFFNDIDAGMGVATGTNQNDARFAHGFA